MHNRIKNKISFKPNTLSYGYIGSIDVPAASITQPHCQDNANSLIHTIFYSLYPDRTEPKPPVRRSPFRKTKIEIHNLQLFHFLNRPLPLLPYSPEIQQFLKKNNIQNCDVNNDGYLKLCSILVKFQLCYATHCNDVGKRATPFRIRPNQMLNSKLKDPPKNLFTIDATFEELHDEFEKHDNIRQICSTPLILPSMVPLL